MTATRIDPNTLRPEAEDGKASATPEFYDTVIAAINEHADDIDGGGLGGGNDLLVTSYGATGDGVTDDATSIGLAVAAAIAQKKRLFFPAGTYLIGSTITVAAVSGIRLAGLEATILYASLTRHAFTFSANSTRVRVDGLAFEGDHSDDKDLNFGTALNVSTSTTDIDVVDCTFTYCRPIIVASDYSTTGRFTFRGNRVFNAPDPISTSQYSIITGNWFINDARVATRSHAVYLFGPVEGCLIANNVFKNIAAEDVQIRAGAARFEQKFGFVIANNYFEKSGQDPIWVGSDTTLKAGGYSITGNVFKNCNACIFAEGLSDSVIANNAGEWDWEYDGARGGGTAIAVLDGTSLAQRYGTSKGMLVTGNQLSHRHPYFGKVKLDTVPADGDTLTIDGTVNGANVTVIYTWRNTPTVAGDVQISAGDIPDCLGLLENAILGTNSDALNDTDPHIRFASDVFYNAFVGLDPVTDELVIVGGNIFTLAKTGASMTLTAPIDNRDACDQGISVSQSLSPLISGNAIDNFKTAIAVQHCYAPTVQGNVSKGGAPILGVGNALSVYRGNRSTDVDQYNTSAFRQFRLLLVKDGFPLFIDNGITTEQEYTTRELIGPAGRVVTGGRDTTTTLGKARTFLFYGHDQFGDGDVNTELFSWRDGDQVQFRGATLTNLDLTFKRTAPGAGQFNSATTLRNAINASTDWRARFADFVNVGGTTDPLMMLELYLAAEGNPGIDPKSPAGNPPRVYVTTRAKTCGVTLNVDGETYSPFLGGATGPNYNRTAIFSPLASDQVTAIVQGMDSAAYALAPAVYLADQVYGVGYIINHGNATGAEEFAFRFLTQ